MIKAQRDRLHWWSKESGIKGSALIPALSCGDAGLVTCVPTEWILQRCVVSIFPQVSPAPSWDQPPTKLIITPWWSACLHCMLQITIYHYILQVLYRPRHKKQLSDTLCRLKWDDNWPTQKESTEKHMWLWRGCWNNTEMWKMASIFL